jgi:hypothetical protein
MTVVAKYVAIGEEATFGTEVAATDYINVPRVDPKETLKWVDQDGIASSSLGSSEIGEKASGVEWDMYMNYVDGVGWLLKWLLGDPTSAQLGATAAYSHTYICDDVLKSFTVLVGSEDETEVPYLGQTMKSIEFSTTPGGYLMMKASTYGKFKGADNTIGSPTFSAVVPAMHHNLTWKVATVDKSIYLGASSITITNNPREGALAAGSQEIPVKAKHTKRRVEWSVELVNYDAAMRTVFHAGTKTALQWSWVGANIASTYYYTLTIDIGEAVVSDYSHPKQGRDVEVHKFGGFAEYKSTDSEIKVTLINTDTDYPDAA